jgi:MinD-like ATPase involved in chromosome partitioning or flagellar assembly
MPSIIALQACRHGTGCSHLAANLAVLLMQRGQRVGILDTDPRNGGIHVLFGLEEATSIPGSYWWLQADPDNPHHLKAQALAYGSVPSLRQPGIYMVANPSPGHGISHHVRDLQQHYGISTPTEVLGRLQVDMRLNYLILDTQPSLDDESLLCLALADTVALMLQLDNYDFQRIAVVLEVIKKLGDRHLSLIPSQVLPDLAPTDVITKLQETYTLPVAGVLPLTPEMVELASNGIFCLHYPDHPFTQQLRALADTLAPPPSAPLPDLSPTSTRKLGKSRGRPLFGILDLPVLERQVLMTVIRRGTMTHSEILAEIDSDDAAVNQALQDLIAQGWLLQDLTQNTVHYQSPIQGDRGAMT